LVGTYPVSNDTEFGAGTHIDLIVLGTVESENTREGAVTIIEVNTTTKIVRGTFHFKTGDSFSETPYVTNFDITDGTFNYRYDVPEEN
jgi:hypothetical protein